MSDFYEKYWEKKNGHLDDFNLKWPVLHGYIPKEKSITVLDFGCGKGEILGEIAGINPDARCIGIDVSVKAIEDARKKYHKFTFHKISDGEKMPIENESIDFVFSSEVIEHIYDTENAVSEIARVLKSGGKLLLTTPYHGFLKNLAITLFGFDKHFNPIGPHIRFFSKKTLSALLQKYGLKSREFKYYGRFYPFSHSIVVLAKKI